MDQFYKRSSKKPCSPHLQSLTENHGSTTSMLPNFQCTPRPDVRRPEPPGQVPTRSRQVAPCTHCKLLPCTTHGSQLRFVACPHVKCFSIGFQYIQWFHHGFCKNRLPKESLAHDVRSPHLSRLGCSCPSIEASRSPGQASALARIFEVLVAVQSVQISDSALCLLSLVVTRLHSSSLVFTSNLMRYSC